MRAQMCRKEVVVVAALAVVAVEIVVERPTQEFAENSQTIFLMSNDIRIQTYTHKQKTLLLLHQA